MSPSIPPSPVSATPASTNHSPGAHALLQRARTGLLFNALRPPTERNNFEYWQGYARALNDIGRAAGDALAAKDAASGGYQTPPILQAAAGFLGDDVYALSRAEVADRLRGAGIELPADSVASGDVAAAHELEDAVVSTVNVHHEHAVARVVGHDGASLHGASVGEGVAA